MKNLMMILGLVLLVTTSGCGLLGGGMYGRGAAGAYGYGAGPYGSAGGVGGPMASGPMVGGPPGYTPGALPMGARGRAMPYGGSAYYGTGYTSPEAVASADMARRAWRDAASATPTVPLAVSPCESGSCPVPVVAPDPRDERIEALEDQVVELLARDAD
jgi:hypothetical protein